MTETQDASGDDAGTPVADRPYRNQVTEEYGVEPISQQELTAHERKVKMFLVILAAVVLIVLLVLLLVGSRFVGVRVSLPQADPYDDVNVVSRTEPQPVSDPRPMARRLENISDASWALSIYDRRGHPRMEGIPEPITSRLRVPDEEAFLEDFSGLITNIGDTRSVEQNGHLVALLSFDRTDNRAWLSENPTVFTDADVEERRQTYWMGTVVVLYAPPENGTDYSEDLRTWVKEITLCPTHADNCEVEADPDLAGYDDWVE